MKSGLNFKNESWNSYVNGILLFENKFYYSRLISKYFWTPTEQIAELLKSRKIKKYPLEMIEIENYLALNKIDAVLNFSAWEKVIRNKNEKYLETSPATWEYQKYALLKSENND